DPIGVDIGNFDLSFRDDPSTGIGHQSGNRARTDLREGAQAAQQKGRKQKQRPALDDRSAAKKIRDTLTDRSRLQKFTSHKIPLSNFLKALVESLQCRPNDRV